eukprot:126464_1
MWNKFIVFVTCYFIAYGSSPQISASLNITSSQNPVAQEMLKMVQQTFGDSKWKLAQADGAFTNGLMKIVSSTMQQPIIGHLKTYGETEVRKVMLWAKIYELASTEYEKTYKDYQENQQLSQQISDLTQSRQTEQEQKILEIVNYLITENTGQGQQSSVILP